MSLKITILKENENATNEMSIIFFLIAVMCLKECIVAYFEFLHMTIPVLLLVHGPDVRHVLSVNFNVQFCH